MLAILAALTVALSAASPATAGIANDERALVTESFAPPQAYELIEMTTAPMVPVCELLTEEATDYIIENNLDLCGYGQPGTHGGATPLGYSNGLCGSSALFLYNGNFSGQARISYGFTSTAGAVVVRSLVVNWAGATSSGSYTDFSAMNAVGYNNNIYRTTGVGTAAADLGGTVLTSWGLWCTIGTPWDQRHIS
ncbi:MAG: hypothetical protein KIT89_13380 [Microcella sp.]|uniref:hypothetical protein n=1 Tax=Microcella sp. TaxID=1913979 RepID=UPI0024C68A75|nr:hypothetical protein [Microcella sp.]UYN83641.1 MAG: hypothetical protein KIT89_13380 [Microcella sp.]